MSIFESAFSYTNQESPDSGLVSRLNDLISEHAQILRKINLVVRDPSKETLLDFDLLPRERKLLILANLRFQNDVILEASAGLSPADIASNGQFTREKELPYLMTALRKAGLRLGDCSILDQIKDDDIIEVLDSRGVQIYRSWSCYKYCAYSLAELLVYDWDTLYVRPSWVAKKLHEMAPLLYQPGAATMPYMLPEYTITERLLKNDRVLLFEMKHASPLVCVDSRRTIALISTGRMKALQNSHAASQIHMI